MSAIQNGAKLSAVSGRVFGKHKNTTYNNLSSLAAFAVTGGV